MSEEIKLKQRTPEERELYFGQKIMEAKQEILRLQAENAEKDREIADLTSELLKKHMACWDCAFTGDAQEKCPSCGGVNISLSIGESWETALLKIKQLERSLAEARSIVEEHAERGGCYCKWNQGKKCSWCRANALLTRPPASSESGERMVHPDAEPWKITDVLAPDRREPPSMEDQFAFMLKEAEKAGILPRILEMIAKIQPAPEKPAAREWVEKVRTKLYRLEAEIAEFGRGRSLIQEILNLLPPTDPAKGGG